MDDFTYNHLQFWAGRVLFEDEREAFIDWVASLDDEERFHYEAAGWPVAASAWRLLTR